MPGDSFINSRLTGTVPNQFREMMSSGVVTQGSVANVSSSQSRGAGGQVPSCMGEAPMQMPMTVQHKLGRIHLCQIIREVRLDNQ